MAENETQVVAEEESVDDILQSVSDKILKKKKQRRKITLSIISALVLALAVVIITLACVQVNLKPEFMKPATSYSFTTKDNGTKLYDNNHEKYNEICDNYEDMFKLSYLTAIFTGSLGDYRIEQTNDRFYSNNESMSGIYSSLESKLGENYLCISYDGNDQYIYNPDGSVCMSKYYSTYKLKYKHVYVALNSEDKIQDTVFYLGAYEEGKTEKVSPKIVKIIVKANTSKLYQFVVGK